MSEQAKPSFLYRVGVARLIAFVIILVIIGVWSLISIYYPSFKCAVQDIISDTVAEMSPECRPNDT